MRRITTARLGIAVALATMSAIGAVAAGCTSDDSTSPVTGDGGLSSDTGPGNPDAPIVVVPNDGGSTDAGTDSTVPPDGGQTTPDGGSDAGMDSGFDSGFDAGPDAASTPDAGTDANTVLADARLVFVHAAPGLGPVRLCFGVMNAGTATVAAIPALPDSPASAPPYPPPPTGTGGVVTPGTPGFYPGTIRAVPDITSLQNIALVPYVIDATLIANQTIDGGADGGQELTCPQLIGEHGRGTSDSPAGILDASEFTTLPTIPSGTLLDGNTYLLSITGCVGGFPPPVGDTDDTNQNICGASYPLDGGNNLAMGISLLDTTTPIASDVWGVQFAHRSSALEGASVRFNGDEENVFEHPAASDGVLPGFIIVPADGGVTQSFVPIESQPVQTSGAQLTALQTVPVDPTTTLAAGLTFPGSQSDGGAVFMPYPGAPATGLGDVLALSLTATAQLSDWSASTASAPVGFARGSGYTIVLLGSNDPNLPRLANPDGGASVNPAYDGRALHFVAFPNTFTAIPLP